MRHANREPDSSAKVWAFIALLLVVGVGAGFWIDSRGPREVPEPYQPPTSPSLHNTVVIGVIDGQTVETLDATGDSATVHILGIEAPPLGTCGAAEAKQFAVDKLMNRGVTLMTDMQRPDADEQDRLLRYVIVSPEGDFATSAAGSGWARSAVGEPKLDKAAQILKAEEAAKANGWGVWGPTCVPTV